MKITYTTLTSQAPVPRPTRRFYSPELKIQVIQECRQGGASVAGVALAHGLTGTGKDQLDNPREVEKCVLSA